MKFQKIKYLAGEVFLDWTLGAQADSASVISLKCGEEPSPEFLKYLNGFTPLFIELCELEPLVNNVEDEKRITVTSITFKYSGEHSKKSIIISGVRTLKNSGGCQTFSTQKQSIDDNQDPVSQGIEKKYIKMLADLETEAEAYVDGSRVQLSLLDNAPKKKKAKGE